MMEVLYANNNIINLLKLEGVGFINLEEQGGTTTLFFKRVDNRIPCKYGCSRLHIHN